MLKTKFALLMALAFAFAIPAWAQSPEKVIVKVTVVDDGLNLKNVPKFSLIVQRINDPAAAATKVSTSADGTVELALSPGRYTAASEKPLSFQNRSFSWEQAFAVERGKPLTIELSSDNAKVESATASAAGGRDISRGGEMFKKLRDGVVTVQGELGPGTGFIVDESGLVLTNQHVIDQSNEIRVRFDRYTAVKARVLAVDEERDLAVLQINM
ncbi:MAG: hypothetical protein HOP17_01975, partial [Acidobacteria bacterium]|nr:hypothetical protein [Acidobacteriota bacterium]